MPTSKLNCLKIIYKPQDDLYTDLKYDHQEMTVFQRENVFLYRERI